MASELKKFTVSYIVIIALYNLSFILLINGIIDKLQHAFISLGLGVFSLMTCIPGIIILIQKAMECKRCKLSNKKHGPEKESSHCD